MHAWSSTLGLGLVLAFLLGVLVVLQLPNISPTSSNQPAYECTEYYFFNGIVVFNSTINETLVLETPSNVTLEEGFNQTVTPIVLHGVVFNETIKAFTFNVFENESFEGFFITLVKVCTVPAFKQYKVVREALENPLSDSLPSISQVPAGIAEKYVRTPYPKVVEVVKPAFEQWFRERYNMSVTSAKLAGLAVAAAYFIYKVYIVYDPSALPRSIDEVIETRRGDCDDMSRILVELLNAYGIPAVIAYGYTYISGFNYTMPVENVTYKFINNGPHGFVLAYIPDLGWISLDFLAGSLLYYPFIFEGYSRETAVSKEANEQFLDLHRKLQATQVIAVFTKEELSRVVSKLGTQNVLEVLRMLAGYKPLLPGRETVTQTPVTQEVLTTQETTSVVSEHPSSIPSESEVSTTSSTRSEISKVESSGVQPATGATIVLLAVLTLLSVIVITAIIARKHVLH